MFLQVLSRAQAVLSFVNDQVYLKDIGSRNGTFINSLRLSKPFQESEDTPVYSQDIIR
jgi:pSer/pThr/pTyr-binding forkhead associated (FHA) protein